VKRRGRRDCNLLIALVRGDVLQKPGPRRPLPFLHGKRKESRPGEEYAPEGVNACVAGAYNDS
jgi:hypothetical protein